jgi:hypothetical protein
MSEYAKGHKPKDLDAAKGGLVLDRTRSFQKDPDPNYHPIGTGLNGPFNTQSYAKKTYDDPPAICEGETKVLPTVKPRK